MNALGKHILVEFFGCSSEILNDVSQIEQNMLKAAEEAEATIINSTFHHFSPYGVSGVVVIQESHLAIHTWPEYQYAAVDLFTCGEGIDPWLSFDVLKKGFKANNYSATEMHRGSLSLLKRVDFDINNLRTKSQKKILENKDKIKRNVWFTDKDENQALSLRYTGKILFKEKSPYQTVRVLETYAYGKMLTIDNIIMCTERDEFHYHEMITHPAMQMHGKVKNALVIGGGDGGTIRELLKYENIDKVTLVEIDEVVIKASKKFLPNVACEFDNPKLDLKIEDGIKFVKKCDSNLFDIIIIDSSDPVGPAEGLFSEDFYKNCFMLLKNDGIIVAQSESPMFNEKTFLDLNKCFKKIFGKNNVFCELFFAPTYPSGMWSFQVAVKGENNNPLNVDYNIIDEFARKKQLKYYNAEIHRSAFSLPTFVKKMLDES